ncbi:MAG: NAD(P)/FAD-dependent oxidoreductase [Candidatus Edwardsbacteria bacterium]
MDLFDKIIVGGGASGMMASITAASRGEKILLLEKQGFLGRKLLASGSGRCNLTNINLDLHCYHGQNALQFAKTALESFDNQTTIKFFEEMGLRLQVEDEGRVFPSCGESATVVELLKQRLHQLNVNILLHAEVVKIEKKRDFFEVSRRNEGYRGEKIIISCGGKAAPQLGGRESGYQLAQQLGHRIIPLRASLVPLELVGNWFHKLQGVRVTVEISAWLKGKRIDVKRGELLFTKYGLSGPVALKISRVVSDFYDKKDFELRVNFFPGETKESLKHKIKMGLLGLLPHKLIPTLFDENPERLLKNLTSLVIKVKKTRPLSEAQVTAGGVDTSEVYSQILESKIVKGLYFTGEILDIDGDSGGYNLQWAWSSGYLAGSQ